MFASNSTILSSVAGEDNQLAAGALGIAAILTTTAVYFTLRSKGKENGFPKLRGIQLYHAWDFFYRRYDFLLSNFNRSSGKSFSFNVLHHNVIALAGEDARRVLFTTPHFDLSEGIKLLLGIVRVSLVHYRDGPLISETQGPPDRECERYRTRTRC
jgi:hypothetical protein